MVDAHFVKPASGVTPTLPAHLTTKAYVDLAIAPLLPPPSATFTDLDAWLATFIATISSGQTYRDPTTPEAANAIDGIERLGIAGTDAAALLSPLGFTITTGYDSITKRPFALAVNEYGTNRSWGAYLLDLSRPIRLAIEVPHPVFDGNTDLMGLSHWRSTPGAILMIAGCHRDAAAGLPDPTTNINTLFDQVAIAYAAKNVPQVQWHGFADATAPGLTQVVSAATSQVGSAVTRVAAELGNVNGFTVGRYWDSSGSGTSLGATTNVVGQDSASRGTTFIHIENNNTVRTSPANRALAVAATVQAQPELLYLGDAPQLAVATSGQFPSTIGTSNTVGTSPYAARSDHIHRERQATLDRITALETLAPPTDQQTYGDILSTTFRRHAPDAAGMDPGYFTFTTVVAPTSFTATKIRFAVVVAGVVTGTPAVSLGLYSGTASSMTQSATAPITGAMLTTTGVKELTLSASVSVIAGRRYSALFYIPPSAFSTRPSFASVANARAVLINPATSQLFAGYKAASAAAPTTIDTSDGSWTAGTTVTTVLWWALL